MGLSWLNPVNWFRRRAPATTSTTTTPPSARAAAPTTPVTAAAPKAAASTRAAGTTACAATTAAGTPCRSPARPGSKYCGRHKGHRARGATQERTTPAAATASRGTPTGGGNGHVAHGEYRLYRKGNRYFFSKKSVAEARQGGAAPVATMPADRTVVVTPNGLPVLKKA